MKTNKNDAAPTLTLNELKEVFNELISLGHGHDPVRLICDGTAYPVTQVWWEPRQGGDGAVCVGEDPR